MMFIQRLKTCSSAFQLPTHAPRAWNLLYKSPARGRNLLLAVVAVGVRAATVAVVDEAGGGHPEGLQDAFESAEQKGSFETGSESGTCTRQWAHALSIPLSILVAAQHKHRRAQIISANRRSGQLGARVRTRRQE